MPFPLDLLTPAPEGWQWVVLHTKPRCEKKVVGLAGMKEAHFYLPCTTRVRNYGNRERLSEIPLFPGYVFARMPREHLAWYRSNSNVANLLEVMNEQTLLRPLRTIEVSIASGMEIEVVAPVGPGTRVRVTGGPLKGLETEVLEIAGANRVLIQLEMIQKTVAVEIEIAYLAPVS